MKLNAFIARSGFCSRRKAAAFIKEGKVKVNSEVICHPWYELKEKDFVKIGSKLLCAEKNVYIIFNKPRGTTATSEDKFAEKKITDLIPKHLGRVYPVGRLDKDSRGLMILTNDGDLCHKLTHPRFEVEKEYLLKVRGKPGAPAIEKMKKGIRDGGDFLKIKSAYIRWSKTNKTQIKVVVCEGKKRHLRRLFSRLGFPVLDLKRERIGNLMLGDLEEGAFKIVDRKTIYRLTLER